MIIFKKCVYLFNQDVFIKTDILLALVSYTSVGTRYLRVDEVNFVEDSF